MVTLLQNPLLLGSPPGHTDLVLHGNGSLEPTCSLELLGRLKMYRSERGMAIKTIQVEEAETQER